MKFAYFPLILLFLWPEPLKFIDYLRNLQPQNGEILRNSMLILAKIKKLWALFLDIFKKPEAQQKKKFLIKKPECNLTSP